MDEKAVRVQRASARPVIDGVMNEEIWRRAPIIDDLHQINPVEFGEPTERTEVRVLYDRDALYIGARLYDAEPERINARVLRQNQPIGSDDRFFVHIDPFNTRRAGYLFGVNANGVRTTSEELLSIGWARVHFAGRSAIQGIRSSAFRQGG